MSQAVEVKKTLFDLVAQANSISAMLAETCGEITPEIEKLMDHVDVALPEKIDGYGVMMDRLEHDGDFYKARADLYSKVARSHYNLQDRIKARLKEAMTQLGKDELKGNDIRFKLTAIAPVIAIDEGKLAPNFKITVTETIPDKDRIKEAVKSGNTPAGVTVTPNYSLRSYVNKKGK